MALLIKYRNEPPQRFCEVELNSGERVALKVDADGVVIERLGHPEASRNILFRGGPDEIAEICGALVSRTLASKASEGRMTPLDIVLAAVVALGSAAKVRKVFREVSHIISGHRTMAVDRQRRQID
jgi:hypothetical protein